MPPTVEVTSARPKSTGLPGPAKYRWFACPRSRNVGVLLRVRARISYATRYASAGEEGSARALPESNAMFCIDPCPRNSVAIRPSTAGRPWVADRARGRGSPVGQDCLLPPRSKVRRRRAQGIGRTCRPGNRSDQVARETKAGHNCREDQEPGVASPVGGYIILGASPGTREGFDCGGYARCGRLCPSSAGRRPLGTLAAGWPSRHRGEVALCVGQDWLCRRGSWPRV